MEWRTCRGPIKGRFDRFPIQRDEGALGELGYSPGPGQKALPKRLGMEPGKDPTKGVMGGNAMGQSEKGVEPGTLALAKKLHVLEPFPTAQERTHSDHQDIEEIVL